MIIREARAALRSSCAEAHIYQGRDLAATTGYRSVLGEIISKHVGDRDLKQVFPGFDHDPRRFLGLVKA